MKQDRDGLDRVTLKSHFKAGNRPTQADFEALIDGTLNLQEDGFSRTDENGLKVHAHEGHDGLFAFHRNAASDTPLWNLGFSGGALSHLALRAGAAAQAPALTLDRAGRLGLGQSDPQCRLDVQGSLRVAGRLGQPPAPEVLAQQAERQRKDALAELVPVHLVADGSWKDLTGDLHGCQGFEVMAGAGLPDSSRFALVHAFAFNVYHPAWWQNLFGLKRRIRCQHAYYARRRHRLELRWFSPDGSHGKPAAYRLQIRSLCDYAGHLRERGKALDLAQEVPIHAYLTQLWFQPQMGSLQMDPGTKPPAP
jgi:hypothetical protein